MSKASASGGAAASEGSSSMALAERPKTVVPVTFPVCNETDALVKEFRRFQQLKDEFPEADTKQFTLVGNVVSLGDFEVNPKSAGILKETIEEVKHVIAELDKLHSLKSRSGRSMNMTNSDSFKIIQIQFMDLCPGVHLKDIFDVKKEELVAAVKILEKARSAPPSAAARRVDKPSAMGKNVLFVSCEVVFFEAAGAKEPQFVIPVIFPSGSKTLDLVSNFDTWKTLRKKLPDISTKEFQESGNTLFFGRYDYTNTASHLSEEKIEKAQKLAKDLLSVEDLQSSEFDKIAEQFEEVCGVKLTDTINWMEYDIEKAIKVFEDARRFDQPTTAAASAVGSSAVSSPSIALTGRKIPPGVHAILLPTGTSFSVKPFSFCLAADESMRELISHALSLQFEKLDPVQRANAQKGAVVAVSRNTPDPVSGKPNAAHRRAVIEDVWKLGSKVRLLLYEIDYGTSEKIDLKTGNVRALTGSYATAQGLALQGRFNLPQQQIEAVEKILKKEYEEKRINLQAALIKHYDDAHNAHVIDLFNRNGTSLTQLVLNKVFKGPVPGEPLEYGPGLPSLRKLPADEYYDVTVGSVVNADQFFVSLNREDQQRDAISVFLRNGSEPLGELPVDGTLSTTKHYAVKCADDKFRRAYFVGGRTDQVLLRRYDDGQIETVFDDDIAAKVKLLADAHIRISSPLELKCSERIGRNCPPPPPSKEKLEEIERERLERGGEPLSDKEKEMREKAYETMEAKYKKRMAKEKPREAKDKLMFSKLSLVGGVGRILLNDPEEQLLHKVELKDGKGNDVFVYMDQFKSAQEVAAKEANKEAERRQRMEMEGWKLDFSVPAPSDVNLGNGEQLSVLLQPNRPGETFEFDRDDVFFATVLGTDDKIRCCIPVDQRFEGFTRGAVYLCTIHGKRLDGVYEVSLEDITEPELVSLAEVEAAEKAAKGEAKVEPPPKYKKISSLNEHDGLKVGDDVAWIKEGKVGRVFFIGTIEGRDDKGDIYAGVELKEEGSGLNDGLEGSAPKRSKACVFTRCGQRVLKRLTHEPVDLKSLSPMEKLLYDLLYDAYSIITDGKLAFIDVPGKRYFCSTPDCSCRNGDGHTLDYKTAKRLQKTATGEGATKGAKSAAEKLTVDDANACRCTDRTEPHKRDDCRKAYF